MINLTELRPNKGARKRRIVVGRGNASGHGTYSGRGVKGQKARTGGRKGLKQLGMRSLLSQTPKLGGFQSKSREMNAVNVTDLDKMFKDNDVITPRTLMLKREFSNKKRGIKILGSGKIIKKFEVRAHDFSIAARKVITEAGGKAVIIPIWKKR